MRVRHLPLVQNWDCHSCTNCCREYEVAISEEERQRFIAQGWQQDPELGRLKLFRRRGLFSRRYTLRHRAEGGCVFLSKENRCLIHERFGAEAKPLACRLFPFALVPAGNHWRVSLRFSCPSVAKNVGRPIGEHEPELNQYARLLEQFEENQAESLPPPPLQRGQQVAWPDLLRFVHVLTSLLSNKSDRVELRVRKCLALARTCRQARFDKLEGGRLAEFLDLVSSNLDADVPAEPANVQAPSWVGHLLFRQVLAIYARKDRGPNRGPALRSRWSRFKAALRFARGRGKIPQLNAFVPDTTFQQVESASGVLPAAVEDMLERYVLVKVGSLQFCGPTNFGLAFWDGLESLALAFAAILWLARALAQLEREEAVRTAVHLVDDHFGYNRVFGSRRLRFVLRTLAQRNELERLIAWYSR